MFADQNGERPRTILLSSASPAEGKSTVVSNLGIAIAEVGNRVLIIDADMRKPRLYSIFGVDEKPGLAEYLKDCKTPGIPSGLIKPTEVPNLFLLPSGEPTSAALGLLHGNKMPDLLRQLKQQFDIILIDTPPMLQISDARVLAHMVDAVILVVRADQTTRDAAQAAVQRFHEDGSTVLGTILNDWNPKHAPGGYYGYGKYDAYKRYYGAN
jgi:capsular exopolysaccharide synthesis family protein